MSNTNSTRLHGNEAISFDWRETFELDTDRYVAIKDDYTTFCSTIPARMTLADAMADYASEYDGACDACVAELMVDGDSVERVEFAVANREVR